MAKRKPKGSPVYDHPRTAFKGIEERLMLASCVWSESSPCVQASLEGMYMHRVRFLSKKEGWECRYMWTSTSARIDFADPGMRRNVALGIEAARQRWFEAQHPSKELLAIVAAVKSRKAA